MVCAPPARVKQKTRRVDANELAELVRPRLMDRLLRLENAEAGTLVAARAKASEMRQLCQLE